jgi:hypothetical protein
MTIEKRKFILGIIPGKKEPALPQDVELRSPKLSLGDHVIGITIDSQSTLTYFKDGFSETVTKEKINKRKLRVRHTLFTSYGYKYKR